MIPIQATHVSSVVISEFDGIKKMLLLERVKGGYWCHVAGGVEEGETGWQTIVRELKEETQIEDVELHRSDSGQRADRYLYSRACCLTCPPGGRLAKAAQCFTFALAGG